MTVFKILLLLLGGMLLTPLVALLIFIGPYVLLGAFILFCIAGVVSSYRFRKRQNKEGA